MRLGRAIGYLCAVAMLVIAAVLALQLVGRYLQPGKNPAPTQGQPDESASASASPTPEQNWAGTIVVDGKTYRRRTNLRNILLLGVDDTKTFEAEGIMVGNNGRADAVVLFILDKTAKTTRALTISRNSMTDVDVYKGNGDLAYTGVMQLNMQYAYGNSAARSNFLMKRTVSELLYNTRIDGCLSMTMEGIAVIVDGMGGITLTMPADYTEIDERYTAGATVTLDGAAAEHFLRYRDVYDRGSAEDRLDRQSWFMHTMFHQLKEQGDLEERLNWMMDTAGEYIETDLDAETLQMLAQYDMLDETDKVPGKSVAGELHDEFYVDEEALQALIVELFYEPVA